MRLVPVAAHPGVDLERHLQLRSRGHGVGGSVEGAQPQIRSFDTVEELRQALLEFRDTHNATWLIEQHEFRPPNAVRQDRLSTAALAV